MAKKKQPLTAAHQEFMSSAPAEHQAAFSEALADAAPQVRGSIIDIIRDLRALDIPWLKLAALLPLIAAAFANPLTGIGPLIMAIAALFSSPALAAKVTEILHRRGLTQFAPVGSAPPA